MKKLSLVLFAIFILTACDSDDTGPRASLGSPDAPILVEEFSDFECPACANIAPELEALVKRNLDLVRLEFHHFPLPYHENAFRAAEASECALDQGKFWEFAELAFANQKSLIDDNLKSFAGQLGLDRTVFDECFDGNEKRSRIKADTYEGRRRKLSYTPSLYVNGQLIKYSGPEEFEAYLKSL